MKKLIMIAVFAAACVATQAQTTFGVKGGVNISNFIGDDSDEANSLIGFNIGGTVDIPLSSMFSFSPEVSYSSEGAKYDAGSEDLKYILGYVNVPMMFKYKSNGFFGEFGPQVGFLTSAKAKFDGDDEDIKDSFKSISFAANIGAGYQMKSGLGFGVRYSLGLANIIDDDDADLKTGVISVGLRYNFKSN